MTEPAGAGAVATAAPRTGRELAPGTLGRQLVGRVVALICALTLALSALSLAVAGATMLRALDHDVADNAGRDFGFNRAQQGNDRVAFPHYGKAAGTISVTVDTTGNVAAVLVARDGGDELADADLAALLALPRDNRLHTVHLPTLGTYRVYSGTQPPAGATMGDPAKGTSRRDPSTPTVGPAAAIMSGLPMGPLLQQLGSVALADLGLAILAVASAVAVMRRIVRRSLRPLNELAATAHAVSSLELDRGSVALEQRVAVDPATPRNEVTRVGTAFNQMLDHVAGALQARAQTESKLRAFVADASHELRNPLAAIRGYAEVMRPRSAELPDDAAFAMRRIDAEAQRMSVLVEDLLLLARLDNNRSLEFADVDLTALLIDAVSDARVAGPHHTWRLELPDEPMTVRGDAARLHQVVLNLLTNARVHTPAGTNVVASLRPLPDAVELAVHDDGPGIAPEVTATVFDRFVRADASRARTNASSTGLGLSIVRSVVEGHGGTVDVDSRPGATTFRVVLPAQG